MDDQTCRCPGDGEHQPGPTDPEGNVFCRWCGKPLIMVNDRLSPVYNDCVFGCFVIVCAIAATWLFWTLAR
jgi:hypothetical protein